MTKCLRCDAPLSADFAEPVCESCWQECAREAAGALDALGDGSDDPAEPRAD